MKKNIDSLPQWNKVHLENSIFIQAQKEGAYLYARLGKIYQRGASAFLRALLGVYNHFFASQNRRFVRETCNEEQAEREIFILEYDSAAAGYALTARSFSQEAGGFVVWIEEIYIREPYRSKGLGREFFNYIEKEKDRDTVRIRLEVEEKNERAQSLYRQLGYEVLDYVQMIKDF